jgi:2-phosphosulfolactate phosphatase
MIADAEGKVEAVRCEWGAAGLAAGLAGAKAVVIVDVLSFSTAVDIAVARGARVFPYFQPDGGAAAFARERGAQLAGRDRQRGYSLSPASLLGLGPGEALVLPSPNGSRLSLGTGSIPTYCGCLRNAATVAQAAARHGGPILVVAAGERWPDGSLRPGTEDWLGAGAVIHALAGPRSPEAALAEAGFLAAREDLEGYLARCPSGRELIGWGCAADVALAAELNVSVTAPRLIDGAYGWE